MLGNVRFNIILRILTLSDIFLWGGYYMMNALVAIYLEEKIQFDPIETISFGFSVYLIARSLIQIPVARVLDKYKTYMDETWSIAIGSLLTGISIYMYIFITQPWHLFVVQSMFGLAVALNLPAWRKTMARFIDKGSEAMEYSIYDILTNLLIATLTALGGIVVNKLGGFPALFTIAGTIPIIGAFVTLYLLKNRRIQHEYK